MGDLGEKVARFQKTSPVLLSKAKSKSPEKIEKSPEKVGKSLRVY